MLRISLALFACILMIVPSLASPKTSSIQSNISSDNVTKISLEEQDKNSNTQPGCVSYPSDLLDPSNSADYLIITSDPFYTDAKLDRPIVPRYPPTVQITGIQPLNSQGETGKVALIQGTARDPAHDSIEWIELRVMKYNSLNQAYDEINKKSIYFNNNHGDVSWSCCMGIAPTSGAYCIAATASNGECTSEAPWPYMWFNICVGAGFPPVAQALPKYQEVEVDQTVSFDGRGSFDPDNTTPITGYTWSINGVVISHEEKANYKFTKVGSYEISLTVSSGSGGPHPEFGTDTCTVSVVESPVNHPPFANATPFSQGGLINEMFTFDGTTSNDPDNDELTYSWDFGDHTTGSGSTVSHCYPAAGTYTVSLTVNDGRSSDTDTCLVLVSTTYRNKLNEFAHWRSEYNGFNVAVVNVNDLGYWVDPSNPVLNSDVTIKNFIKYVYNYWSAPHMSDHHVGYILLVGDTPFVATHEAYASDSAADRWYGCFIRDGHTGFYVGDEDYLTAEIMIGRFSVDDYNELYTNAEKTIQYEKNPEPGEWQKHTLLCAGEAVIPRCDFIEETLRKLRWNLSEVFYEEGGTAEDVVENISDGQTIVEYCDHGGVDQWSYLNFYVSHIQQLTNARKLPLVYSLACLTGSFQNASDCLGEEFLNNPYGGAVAFFGASIPTATDSLNLAPYLFSSIIQPGNGKHIVGEIITEGLIQYGYGWPEYNLLGDPALNLSIELPPLRVADAHGPYTGVIGHPVQFIGSVIGDIPPPYTWSWDFGNGYTSADQNPAYTYCHPGVYIVTLTVVDSAGNTANDSTTATITPLIVHTNGPYRGVTGQPVRFTGFVDGGFPQYIWSWDFGDGNTSQDQNPAYTYHSVGTYTVTLTVVDSEGNIASDTTTAAIELGEVFVDDDYTEFTPGWGYDHFDSIQDGIDAVGEHGTVFVSPGIYHENIVITKPLHLIGTNKDSTMIDGSGNNVAVSILDTDEVTVEGFTIKNGAVGIKLQASSYNHIFNNIITKDNENSGDGILLVGTDGASGHGTANNVISQNTISDNNRGIFVKKFSFGINPTNNLIYHNNFLNNAENAYDKCENNNWDNGYPSGGNYWGNYTGSDKYSGPNQNILGSDGIGDTPYNISGKNPPNQDRYPLMYRFVLGDIGDMNHDGYVSWRDIDPFVLALSSGEATFYKQFPNGNWFAADCNQDGVLNWRDIDPFISILCNQQ